ncbi:MAG: peptidoglycan-binding protein [Acetobacteraceae bacterium]|nr:peptidoglycan-binding protein [Acetobacteraceae bacterium]MBV8522975.1 peptidoglycan-binding protein [Acetobacteraceae bacterium]MBV8591525.1 peptidoglycan-binding protein [Acetobacteraceae bacterium]
MESKQKIDGIADPLTIDAITNFQASFGSIQDGRVDPAGRTSTTSFARADRDQVESPKAVHIA